YVYTSVGSAHKRTGIPHFDNKWRIEETVRGLRFPSHVILRPVFFMENLLAPYSLQGPTLAWALGPGTKLQMIAVDDIGSFGPRAHEAPRLGTPPRATKWALKRENPSEAPARVAPTGQTQGELA